MNPAILNSQFVQIALPIMVTFIGAAWLNGKRIDDLKGDTNRRIDDLRADMNLLRADMNRRFDDIIQRLSRIETLLTDHDQRLTRLERAYIASSPAINFSR